MAPEPSAAPKNERKWFQTVRLSYFNRGSIPPRCVGREKWKLTHVETNTLLIFWMYQWATRKAAMWSFMHLSRLKKPKKQKPTRPLSNFASRKAVRSCQKPPGCECSHLKPSPVWAQRRPPSCPAQAARPARLEHKQAPGQLQVRAGARATATLSSYSSQTRQPGRSPRQQHLHKQL